MPQCNPSHVEPGLSQVPDSGQGDISKHDEKRGLMSTCTLEPVFLEYSVEARSHVRSPTTQRQPCCEDIKASYTERPPGEAIRCYTCK